MKVLRSEPEQRPDEHALRTLVALSRRSLQGEAPYRGERSFERVRDALRERRARGNAGWRVWTTRVRPRLAGGLLLAAALGGAALYLAAGGRAPLSYDVSGAVAMASGDIVGGEQTRLRFTDGSELTLSRGARARVTSLDVRGGEIALATGSARVAIEKRERSRWVVRAGPYRVRVTGTEFDVRWSQDARTFSLSMQRGEVYVSGPLLAGEVRVRDGQGVRAMLASGEVVVGEAAIGLPDATTEPAESVEAPSDPEATRHSAAAEETERTAAAADQTRDDRPAERRRTLPSDGKGPWAQRLSRGDFDGVLRAADRFGIERALTSTPLHELAALADAARFLRRDELAERALLAARKRFPRSTVAADAAFLLGRLQEREEGKRAADWYARYLRESPRGPYARQALGRRMLQVFKAQGADAARPLAETYLGRYAGGAYAESARRVLSSSSAPSAER